MKMLDTNIILRYLLNDNQEMADMAEKIIQEGDVCVTTEVIAEVVYVLKGVYSTPRNQISETLTNFLKEVETDEPEVLSLALEIYSIRNLDFVDCILYANNRIKKYEICTFDKKLKQLLDEK